MPYLRVTETRVLQTGVFKNADSSKSKSQISKSRKVHFSASVTSCQHFVSLQSGSKSNQFLEIVLSLVDVFVFLQHTGQIVIITVE